MKAGVCVLYITALFLYFAFDFGGYWNDIYLQAQALMVAFLSYTLYKRKSILEHERLLFKFIAWIAVADSAYTFVCMFRGKDFAIHNTNVFAYIIGFSVVVLLGHIAYNKDKFK